MRENACMTISAKTNPGEHAPGPPKISPQTQFGRTTFQLPATALQCILGPIKTVS